MTIANTEAEVEMRQKSKNFVFWMVTFEMHVVYMLNQLASYTSVELRK